MTKKDFQALARALYNVKPSHLTVMGKEEHIAPAQWHLTVSSIADACKASNPRFDRARFIEACETGTTRGMKECGHSS